MFGSTLGLWAIHSMVPGHPGSVEHGLFLMAWASSSIMHWLATPTSSFPPLPQHILQAGQIVGQRFCGCVDVHRFACGGPFHTKETRTQGRRLLVGTS
jgi:hypothetical protein